jgi:membrane-bound serine protease (ClpP class)
VLRLTGRTLTLALLLGGIALGWLAPAQAQDVRGAIYSARVEGPVTSATIDYLRSALQQAESANATALIITLQSNGGVLRDMRSFAGEIAQAQAPVVVFVAPSGTESGAAGTLFLSAAHLSAMAPNTSFGSPYPLAQVDQTLSQQTRDLVLDSVTDQVREWNQAQGRNTDWIDRAVREGVILNNEQATALEPPAVDIIATNQDQLLTLLEGRTVTLANTGAVQLSTIGRSVTPIEPTLWQSLRLILATPTVAFALLVLGAISIYMEFAAPGSTLFAGLGVVLLIGAFVGFIALPIQWWALLLVLFALILIGGEFFATSHGGLIVTGIVLLVIGALNLIDPAQAPGAPVAIWAIGAVAAGLGGFGAFGVWLALRSRTQPITTGQEGMIGRVAEVRRRLDPEGMVFVEGALWQAVSEDGEVEVGDLVHISAMHNLKLIVRRIETEQDT